MALRGDRGGALALELTAAQTWKALQDGCWPTGGRVTRMTLEEPRFRDHALDDELRDEMDFSTARPLPRSGFRYSGRLALDVVLDDEGVRARPTDPPGAVQLAFPRGA